MQRVVSEPSPVVYRRMGHTGHAAAATGESQEDASAFRLLSSVYLRWRHTQEFEIVPRASKHVFPVIDVAARWWDVQFRDREPEDVREGDLLSSDMRFV